MEKRFNALVNWLRTRVGYDEMEALNAWEKKRTKAERLRQTELVNARAKLAELEAEDEE